METKAKFRCVSKTQLENGHGRVEFVPVKGGSKENETFWKYTPSGRIEMYIDNEESFSSFTVGKEYYVTFLDADYPIN